MSNILDRYVFGSVSLSQFIWCCQIQIESNYRFISFHLNGKISLEEKISFDFESASI